MGEEQRFISSLMKKIWLTISMYRNFKYFLQNFVVMYVKYFLSSKHRKEKPYIIILVTLATKNSILHILISVASAENVM